MLAFISILKAFMPFLKEWLFDKKTIKAWFKKNLGIIVMLVMVLLMFYTLERMLTHVIYVKNQYAQIRDLNEDLVRQRKWLTTRNESQEKLIESLTAQNKTYSEKITRYEHWMAACGMNYTVVESDMPTCRNITPERPATPARTAPATPPARPRPTQPRRAPRPAATPSTKRDSTTSRIREIWGAKK